MTYDQTDVQNMALCAWKESRGDGIGACYAQMHVVMNRVKAPDFPKTVHDVIYQKNAFTSMSVPTDPEYNLVPPADDAVWQACLTDAPNVLGGDDDPTGGAVWYSNEKNVTSGWYKDNIETAAHPITVVIGHHTFRK